MTSLRGSRRAGATRMSDDEGEDVAAFLAGIYAGPAPFVNRHHISNSGRLVRVGLGEQYTTSVAPGYRAGFVMDIWYARQLANALTAYLDEMDAEERRRFGDDDVEVG